MAKRILCLTFVLLFPFTILTEVEGAKKTFGLYAAKKLFVFGDSYVDTGNFVHSESYKPPNGMTFPGTPAGRFCDGRIITDYISSFLKIESPTPNAFRNSSNMQFGINFAYGGTGIFNTSINGPNMTAQIDSFQKLIQQNILTKIDLQSSIALVNAGANDYTNALKTGRFLELPLFIESLVEQMSVNLNRIHSLGINKVAVGLLQPIGCLPAVNIISFRTSCIGLLNLVSKDHNKKLLEAIQKLNNQAGKSVFVTLDLYSTFLSKIEEMQKEHDENKTRLNPLHPCCDVKDLGDSCGTVNDKGEKKYTLCENPRESFFWDNVHLSQNGWSRVYSLLVPSLGQLTQRTYN